MALLRPLAEIAAEAYRNSVDFALLAIEDTINNDPRSWTWRPDPAETNVRFVPAREGKSLLSPIKRRTLFKRKHFPRWSDL